MFKKQTLIKIEQILTIIF